MRTFGNRMVRAWLWELWPLPLNQWLEFERPVRACSDGHICRWQLITVVKTWSETVSIQILKSYTSCESLGKLFNLIWGELNMEHRRPEPIWVSSHPSASCHLHLCTSFWTSNPITIFFCSLHFVLRTGSFLLESSGWCSLVFSPLHWIWC